MQTDDSRHAVGDGPINLRTVKRSELGISQREKIGSQTAEHIERLQNRLSSGNSLESKLIQAKPGKERIHPLKIFAPVLLLVGLGSIVLGSRLPSILWIGVGALCTAGSIAAFVWVYRSQQASALVFNSPTQIVSTEIIQKFDQLVADVSAELDAVNANALNNIKNRLAQIIKLATQEGISEHFTSEDQMYVTESIRRYIPDSLQAYLSIPKKQRTERLPNSNDTANTLLAKQLALIDERLTLNEKKLGFSTSELLLRQQRFLEIKSRS